MIDNLLLFPFSYTIETFEKCQSTMQLRNFFIIFIKKSERLTSEYLLVHEASLESEQKKVLFNLSSFKKMTLASVDTKELFEMLFCDARSPDFSHVLHLIKVLQLKKIFALCLFLNEELFEFFPSDIFYSSHCFRSSLINYFFIRFYHTNFLKTTTK